MKILSFVLLVTLGTYISFTDLKYRRIPNKTLLVILLLTCIGYSFAPRFFPDAALSVLVALFLCIPFVFPTNGHGMGAGDAKLILLIALLLGSPSHFMVAMFLASIFAGLAFILKKLRKRSQLSGIAFAPALVLAALISL